MNGKLPSQDLSAWVTGRGGPPDDANVGAEWEKLIPPLQELSPLSLGDGGSLFTSLIIPLTDKEF